jgi:hypothetical protein
MSNVYYSYSICIGEFYSSRRLLSRIAIDAVNQFWETIWAFSNFPHPDWLNLKSDKDVYKYMLKTSNYINKTEQIRNLFNPTLTGEYPVIWHGRKKNQFDPL